MVEAHLGSYHHPPQLMGDLEARARELGIDLSSIDLDAISLPAGEDFHIASDDDEILQNEDLPEIEMGFANSIVVDNLPAVPPEKFEKLGNVIHKIFSRAGAIKDGGFFMPVNADTNVTYGYCFIEEAQHAREMCNGYKLDKFHMLVVNIFDDFERYMKDPDEWTPAETKPYTPIENLQKWLTEEKARDQFVMRAGMYMEVYWNDARQLTSELIYQHKFWTDSFIEWSPLGTYLATVHKKGSQVWGGEDKFERLMRFAHPQVELIGFSPHERFTVAISPVTLETHIRLS
ncbi:unnamed protein product [Urochloa humidicola]